MGKNTVWTEWKVKKELQKVEDEFNAILKENVEHYNKNVHDAYVDGFKNGELYSRSQIFTALVVDAKLKMNTVKKINQGYIARNDRILDPNDDYCIQQMVKELENYGYELDEADEYIEKWDEIIATYMEMQKDEENTAKRD